MFDHLAACRPAGHRRGRSMRVGAGSRSSKPRPRRTRPRVRMHGLVWTRPPGASRRRCGWRPRLAPTGGPAPRLALPLPDPRGVRGRRLPWGGSCSWSAPRCSSASPWWPSCSRRRRATARTGSRRAAAESPPHRPGGKSPARTACSARSVSGAQPPAGTRSPAGSRMGRTSGGERVRLVGAGRTTPSVSLTNEPVKPLHGVCLYRKSLWIGAFRLTNGRCGVVSNV